MRRRSRRWERPDALLRIAVVHGLGVMMVAVPVEALAGGAVAAAGSGPAIAAVAAAGDHGYVLQWDGAVGRFAGGADGTGDGPGDGEIQRVAEIGPYRTPFGTTVGGRAVFGGIRCAGAECRERVAEVAVLDDRGRTTFLSLERTSGWPSRLDGLVLVGHDGETLWVGAGGSLFQVRPALPQPATVAEVPWPGGEPCVIGGVLYDLAASGGTYGRHGVGSARPARFRLGLTAWDEGSWQPVAGTGRSMAFGENAYCAPGGFEIRSGDATSARWEPGTGWREVKSGPVSNGAAPVSSSTRARYVVDDAGTLRLLDASGPGARRPAAAEVAATTEVAATAQVPAGALPAALQVDDAGTALAWCVTTDPEGHDGTRCGLGPGSPLPRRPGGGVAPASPGVTATAAAGQLRRPAAGLVHHYNLCSAACGNGVRPHSRDIVTWSVEREEPAAVSLNEACYDDTVHLASRLPGYALAAGYVALETATGCPGAVKQFGNALLVHRALGSTTGWWAPFTTQAATPCDNRKQECRGMACSATASRRGAAGGGGRTVYCTAHLESPRHGDAVPVRQAREYAARVADRYGEASTRYLAGDFNLERAVADVQLEAAGYRSPATDPTVGSRRPPGSRQIDMVYGSTPGGWGSAFPRGTTFCDPQASDHCYVTAVWPDRATAVRRGDAHVDSSPFHGGQARWRTWTRSTRPRRSGP